MSNNQKLQESNCAISEILRQHGMENKSIQDFFGTNPSYLIGYAEPQRLISLNLQDHIRARQRVEVAITAYLLQIILELNSAE